MPGGKTHSHTGGTTRFDAIVAEANRLDRVAPPYNNARPPSDSAGYDCSSSCAQLLRTAGYTVPFFNTATAPQYMEEGEDSTGRLTFWNNDISGTAGNSVHIFATINGQDWGTGANAQGGPGWHAHTKEGFKPYHVEHLDQPASLPAGSNPNPPGDTSTNSEVDLTDAEKVAKSAAFATYLNIPGLEQNAESLMLRGERSLMNDQQLLPFIQQLCQASLRRFQSMPNGNFYAFYPDYFGGLGHRTPYWSIEDIEIIDGQIQLSDDALATHVFTVGDNASYFDGVNTADKIQTAGVVSLQDAVVGDLITGLPQEKQRQNNSPKNSYEALHDKGSVLAFLKKYGARPHYEEMPMIRSPYYELFYAYQTFCLLWSKQFETTFQFTYMPEIFPGGIVQFPDHGIQMFVEGVEHVFDYETGFQTLCNLTAPASIKQKDVAVSEGMVRAFALAPEGKK